MKNDFQKNGFLVTKINYNNLSSSIDAEIELIKNNFNQLSKDPYMDQSNGRYRAYSNLILDR